MSLENVKKYFTQFNMENKVLEFDDSSATVELAAERLGVLPQRIAKTLSFILEDGCILIVTAGDAKIDSKKYKQFFGQKAKMVKLEEIEQLTGHEIGGVCPFANPQNVRVYTDISLKRFETVFPACGSERSAIELTPDELYFYGKAVEWVDICKAWNEVH